MMELTPENIRQTAFNLGFSEGKRFGAWECIGIINSFKYKMDAGPDHVIAVIKARFGLDDES